MKHYIETKNRLIVIDDKMDIIYVFKLFKSGNKKYIDSRGMNIETKEIIEVCVPLANFYKEKDND